MAVHVQAASRVLTPASRQVRWLVAGFALGFLVPFVCADLLGLQRDVYYGVYSVCAFGFFGLWAHYTEQSIRAMIARRWVLAIVLGLALAAVMAFIVLRGRASEPGPRSCAVRVARARPSPPPRGSHVGSRQRTDGSPCG